MNTFETIMIYAFAFLLVAPHLGMVLAVIWTIVSPPLAKSKKNTNTTAGQMLMYGKEASNRKQEIDRQHYTIPNQRPKDKHCGKI